MGLLRGCVFKQIVFPLRDGVLVGVGSVVAFVIVYQVFGIGLIFATCRVVVGMRFVHHLNKTFPTHVFRQYGGLGVSLLERVVKTYLVVLGPFGGDKYNAGCRARTVDGGRCRIFKHRERFHVVGVYVSDVARHTINNY